MAKHAPLAGIRARVTSVMVVATALSMVILTLGVARGVRRTLAASTRDYLAESLDRAQACVNRGDLAGAIDASGPVVLQVLDANGQVLASSSEMLSTTPVIEVRRDETDDEDDEDELEDADASEQDDTPSTTPVYGDGSEGYEDGDGASEADEDADDARDAAEDAADDARDAADDAADADDDAREAAEDEAEAAADAAEAAGDADSDDSRDADDDFDEDRYTGTSDSDDGELDDDGDDDAHSAAWFTQRFAKVIRGTANAEPLASQELVQAAEDIVQNRLGLRGPFVVETRQATYQGKQVYLVALASLAAAYDAAASALRLLLFASVAVVAAAAGLTWYLVGRTLRPVEQMRASTLTIVEDDPSQRLEVPDEDRDLRELAATFNDLLARAEQSLLEQQRFVSDASHQLKSPIAAQRAMIETLRAHADETDVNRVVDDLARENSRLQGIVDDLLALARHDEGRTPTLVPVDLIDVIFDEVSSLQAHASQEVDVCGVEPVVVRGDARLLGQAIRNLLDNAARYARSRIAVTCTEHAGKVVVTVTDDGPGIPEADRERVFERFVRLDEGGELSRTSTGLGLAVVRGIVESHDGRAYLEEAEGGGVAAVIELPAA